MKKGELSIIYKAMDNDRLLEILDNSKSSEETCTYEAGYLMSRNYPQKAIVLAGALALAPLSTTIANNELYSNQEPLEFNMEDYNNNIDAPFTKYIQELRKIDYIDVNAKNELIRRIMSFKSLNRNWDGYGALPTEVQSASNAIIFMGYLNRRTLSKITDVYPNPHGTVTMYWENNNDETLSLEMGNEHFNYYLNLNSLEPITIDNVAISEKSANEISKFVSEL
tara:strand:- start:2339 stop:3010 length:672 start_codon:yes stop_codon:yes gene_type:complete